MLRLRLRLLVFVDALVQRALPRSYALPRFHLQNCLVLGILLREANLRFEIGNELADLAVLVLGSFHAVDGLADFGVSQELLQEWAVQPLHDSLREVRALLCPRSWRLNPLALHRRPLRVWKLRLRLRCVVGNGQAIRVLRRLLGG